MPARPPRVFLLSPAKAGGERMSLLLNPRAGFALAWQFQERGAPLGDLFQFASGLYFRGRRARGRASRGVPGGGWGALPILPGLGLLDVDTVITADELRAAAEVPVDL